ncbi:transcriptional activator NhaR [Candidatus Methylomicrobium oryzae]|jgi:LysR family transcriptional activator of nhaA|uniref:transcriptional activator NhaR n=1 Tax=Candidatus Methylomicrobium oryzae TaxID=2802053 RepID=UPI001924E21B|nr:transcriptional activator NhaR [Methylomicrobium sp. RS1]MBL1262547.1 transcriptional activator NhaR [Methylomicrobium sp. RS1]
MINYKHLHYFWVVAKEKSIVKASAQLHLTPQTISGQLSCLEQSMGVVLFNRVGRHLELTDAGRMVLSYANEIFSLGSELQNAVRHRPKKSSLAFKVGIDDVVPKSIAYRLLEPALNIPDPIHFACRENDLDTLLTDLLLHKLDLVISDSPTPPDIDFRGYCDPLGKSGLSIFAAATLAERLQGEFPYCLDNMPLLLPASNTGIRMHLQRWFDKWHIHPAIVGEFEDSALMKEFAQAGAGVIAAPTAIKAEIERKHELIAIGTVEEAVIRYYAISVQRKTPHPAVAAITEKAREWLFKRVE